MACSLALYFAGTALVRERRMFILSSTPTIPRGMKMMNRMIELGQRLVVTASLLSVAVAATGLHGGRPDWDSPNLTMWAVSLMAAPNLPETKGPCTGRAADCAYRDAPELASGQPPPPLPIRD